MTQPISTFRYGFNSAYPPCLQHISFKAKLVAGLILGTIICHRSGLISWVLSLANRVIWRSPPPRAQDTHSSQSTSLGPKTTALYDFLDHLDGITSHSMCLKYKKMAEYLNSTPSLNRLKHSRLAATENALLKNAAAHHVDKSAQLRYLGCGNRNNTDLLQDYINIGKLLRAGYKNLHITIVNCHDSVRGDFGSLVNCAQELGATLQSSFVLSLAEVQKEQFDVIQVRTCVGFEYVFNDFSLTHAQLTDRGHLYLRCEDWDLFFSKTGCIHSEFFQEKLNTPYLTSDLATCLEQVAKQKTSTKELKVALLSDAFYLHQWIHLLPRLCKSSHVEQLKLTLLPPQKSKFIVGQSHKQKHLNPNFPFPSYMAQFLSLICGKKVTVTYIDSPRLGESSNTEFFCKDFGEAEFDMILFLFNYDTEKNLKNRIEALTTTYRTSTLFFELTAENELSRENDAIEDEDLLFDTPSTPTPGAHVSANKQYHYVTWQGTWRWDQHSGVTFIGNKADAEDQVKIKALFS